jgi:hypothetical protein
MALGNKLALLGTLATSFSLAACAGHSTNESTASDQAALDAPNAGLNVASDESPAFDDPAMQALASMDLMIPQTVEPATDPTVAAAAQQGAKAYRIVLLWGHLPTPHDAMDTDAEPQLENWSGKISVDAGAIGMKRTIAFDPNDHVDGPRTDVTSITFTSHTLPYVDGMLLRVVIPQGGTPTLHFATSALTTDIDLSQLAAKVGGVQRLSDDVEGLAWVGYPEDGCTHGFVHGRFVKNHARFGAIRGIVSDGDGERLGHLRGLWGHAPKRDADVWFAKYIDAAGHAKGLAFGKYDDGAFTGAWAAKDETDIDVGHVEGFYSDGNDKADGRGVWLGRWSEKCTP